MAISGPRGSLGLFGGPGFIVALLLLLGGGGFLAYQMIGGGLPKRGASMSLPGSGAESLPHPATGGTALETMPPLAAGAEPTLLEDEAEPLVEIEEDLSPAELLEEYPPDPALALADAAATSDPRLFRHPSAAPPAAKRLALVATGLGVDLALTAQTIVATPPEVTLSFAAGTEDLAGWIMAARAYGHEALVELQLGAEETAGGVPPEIDDRILLAELGREENLRRLDAILASAPKATGVAVHITDSFLGNAAALTPILERLQDGGWIAVGLPVTGPLTVAADRVLTGRLEAGTLRRETLALKALVRQRGAVLVLAAPETATDLARGWMQPGADSSVELSLVPASDLVED